MPKPDERIAEEQRRSLAWCVAVAFLATLAWCLTMFWTRRPALDYFCIFGFMPLILAAVWVVLGWQMLAFMWRYPQSRRLRWIAVIVLAFLLAPYSLLRAGSDMFTLSLQYHLWRAGGADKVQAAFNQWVASQPVLDTSDGRKLLFGQATPDGSILRIPAAQYPPEVRYIHERFPSRFGMTWKDAAYLDNVSVLTTTDIMIGPPGWAPEGGVTAWHRIIGSRRKLADGIWVQFGTYNK
jgi:hypothetical protein